MKIYPKLMGILITCILTLAMSAAEATVYFLNDFETKTCNTAVADAEYVEGKMWDTVPGNPVPYVRCALATPSGTNYVEWAATANLNNIIAELRPTQATLTFGTTYYLAGFFRFSRISGNDLWRDTGAYPYQFDKLLEFRGTGFRWGIGAGWNGYYSAGSDHKFTFDAWYATSVIGDRGPDHIVADQSPYNASKAYLCDYDQWHAVVLGVTINNSNSGRVQLWINGTKIIDQSHYTANAGATLTTLIANGTIAQNQYDAPAHYRQMDRIIVTDNWQDILNGNYMRRPSPPVAN